MSRNEIYQRYLSKDLICKIKEDKELYSKLKKEDRSVFCALTFVIKKVKVNEILAKYSYVFENEVSVNEINNLIKMFLEDANFRNSNFILQEGEASNEVFNFAGEFGVSIQCKEQITTLNSKEKVTQKELGDLRTYGIDELSKMDLDTIEELIDPIVMREFLKTLHSSALVLKACRWNARGLRADLAIRKSYIEKESFSKKI